MSKNLSSNLLITMKILFSFYQIILGLLYIYIYNISGMWLRNSSVVKYVKQFVFLYTAIGTFLAWHIWTEYVVVSIKAEISYYPMVPLLGKYTQALSTDLQKEMHKHINRLTICNYSKQEANLMTFNFKMDK